MDSGLSSSRFLRDLKENETMTDPDEIRNLVGQSR